MAKLEPKKNWALIAYKEEYKAKFNAELDRMKSLSRSTLRTEDMLFPGLQKIINTDHRLTEKDRKELRNYVAASFKQLRTVRGLDGELPLSNFKGHYVFIVITVLDNQVLSRKAYAIELDAVRHMEQFIIDNKLDLTITQFKQTDDCFLNTPLQGSGLYKIVVT